VLDILPEASLLGCRVEDTPIETNAMLLPKQEDGLDNSDRYQKLVEKLNYLTITRPKSHLQLV